MMLSDGRFSFSPSSNSRALEKNWAKVRVETFSLEMTSLRKHLKVSLRPITNMSICNRVSAASGKLYFWYYSRTRVWNDWMDIDSGILFEDSKKITCALDYRFSTNIVLWQFSQPLCSVTFILCCNLRADGRSEYVTLRLRESGLESSQGFGPFGRWQIIIAVDPLWRVNEIFHNTIISEICQE